jgi:ribosomal protein S18 acetylase RimI-like enzyme
MTVNYQLRIVSRQDVADLYETCWPDKSLDAVREIIERAEGIRHRKRGQGIVATLNDKPVGYAQLTLWPRVSEISDLVVTESLRGHGIGTALICFLIDLARSWVMDNVEIGVAMSNHRAYILYRRLGFQSGRIINLDLGLGSEPVMYLTMPLETKQQA